MNLKTINLPKNYSTANTNPVMAQSDQKPNKLLSSPGASSMQLNCLLGKFWPSSQILGFKLWSLDFNCLLFKLFRFTPADDPIYG